MIGQTVSHYKIIEKLGEGGMGVVYRAEDTRLGRTIALKFLPRGLTFDADVKERFLREARAISALEHPNICTIHEIDETDDGLTFICMACYEGRSLRDRLKEGPLPLGDAIAVAIEIAQGLRAAHDAGIIHRDIKPGNVMLTRPGGVRIIDFGLAKLAGETSLTAREKTLGTISYMSPEQAKGESVDHRTDIWSLGVVLYEMVAGRRPFDGQHDQAIIYSILNAKPEPLQRIRKDTPPELDRIVEKALEKNPSDRYRHVAELLDDLKTLTRHLDLASNETTQPWRFTTVRDRVVRRVLLPAAVLIVGAASVWFLTRGRAERPLPVGRPTQVTVGEAWEGQPAVSPDGARIAYVSDESGSYDVHVTDVRGGKTLRLTDDPAMDYAPTWFPDGTALAFVSARGGSRNVWKVGQFGGGATMLVQNAESPAVSPDGTRIAFSRMNQSGNLRICVAPLSNPLDATTLTGDEDGLYGHSDPAWSPDGRTICYAARHNLWTVPAAGGPPRPLTDVGEGDADPAWSADGKYVYFSSDREGTGALWRVSRRGGVPQRLTMGAGHEGEPSVSMDGSRLAYSSGTGETRLVVLNRATGTETELPSLKDAYMAALSPDGRRTVFSSALWGANAAIGDLALEDGRPAGLPRRLTDQPGDAIHPAISPDGTWIAYYRIVGDERDIWLVPSGGGQPRGLIVHAGADIHPAWSPDGSALAFASDRDGQFNIWVAPVAGGSLTGEPRRATRGTIPAYAPSWSPDGKTIAFVGAGESHNDVWIVPADGSAVEQRLTESADANRVGWDPTTGAILMSALCGEDRRTLWSVSPEDGAIAKVQPGVVFGSASAPGTFGVSGDARFMVFSREVLKGDIWVLEAEKGVY